MPKLPIIKDRQLIKAMKRLGFIEHQQRGSSHLILKHANGRRICIPIHPGKDMPRGTLKGILRDADVSVLELKKHL